MQDNYARFGQAEKFEIAIQWVEDRDPPARRPAGYGWSMGHVELTVAGVNLTSNRVDQDQQSYVGWYLAPLLDWLANNWVPLLHEEHFSWQEKSATPAAVACRRALNHWVGFRDPKGRETYRDIQDWYRRHGLRSAAAGGLFPDLFIRRFADDIELSWSGDAPLFAPEGLTFESGAGVSRLAVDDVAEPLWGVLQWVQHNPPINLDGSFKENWNELCQKIDKIGHLSASDFDAAVVANEVLEKIYRSFSDIKRCDLINEFIEEKAPYVKEFSPAVAMFGGIYPQIRNTDVDMLRDVLVSASNGDDSESLSSLVEDRKNLPLGGVPHEDGYQFAEDFLEDIEDYGSAKGTEYIDIYRICSQLGVRIQEERLETDTIRGVALAGKGFNPTILVNLSSVYNKTDDGKRFTIAHELCHVLFDRTRARRIAHTSGPWAPPGVEKRANAFAAYLLMPRELVLKSLSDIKEINAKSIKSLSNKLHVNETALLEHLYNIDLIDDVQREELRASFRSPPTRLTVQ